MLKYAFVHLHAFICFNMLSFAVICFLHAFIAFEAKVSPQEQQARWSLVYRLLPAEAGKKISNL